MTQRVHSEGMRERRNMRENTTNHQLEPKSIDDRGRLHWCCPYHMDQSKNKGVLDMWLDKKGYEYDEDEQKYVEIE